jgi:tetratricopeptide (TPR) repeat protein
VDPAYQSLSQAFEALRATDYDTAVDAFRKAVSISPNRTDIRKNLAYALLKTGESEAAREQFGEAMRLDPADTHVALEYAFLCFETVENAPARKAEARRIFARIRDTGDATAAQAFRNIDEPLVAGIARWKNVLATSKATFSAYYELAQLAEQRDDLELAAASYRSAFQLSPGRKTVLLELARVEKARGNTDGMMAALIAASRGGEPRTAELAREQLPNRYPYVYEFRNALTLDPGNEAVHRELAFLLLSMGEKDQAMRTEAEQEFKKILEKSPKDQLSAKQLQLLERIDTVAASRIQSTPDDARTMGERSYQAGFLKDAQHYFEQAHDESPDDPSIELKLGWTNNMLHDDTAALHWFDLARQSDDRAVAAEAKKAYDNLRTGTERVRTTIWLYPLYSSRWADLFGYGQIKAEFRQKKVPFHPYISTRLTGDARRTTGGISPQSLSESAFIVAAGVASNTWHGAMGWFEAGIMISYLNASRSPDYRGGVTYSHTWGKSLAAESAGWFQETTDDAVFVSHFQDDALFYSQNRSGYTVISGENRLQPFWSENITTDVKRQYWANSIETGPGVRFRNSWMPPSMWVSFGAVHGVYLVNAGNPRGPNFNDFRAGIWYAFTK